MQRGILGEDQVVGKDETVQPVEIDFVPQVPVVARERAVDDGDDIAFFYRTQNLKSIPGAGAHHNSISIGIGDDGQATDLEVRVCQHR